MKTSVTLDERMKGKREVKDEGGQKEAGSDKERKIASENQKETTEDKLWTPQRINYRETNIKRREIEQNGRKER